MKIFGTIVLLLVLAGVIVYADGARLPVDHSVTVSGVVPASQEKVFALITNVAKGADWRPAVKSVTVLKPNQGRDNWVEHLDHGQFMTFLAVRTDSPSRRDVMLDDPRASYGGTWTYELSPGPSPNTTNLRITEAGFIKPPLYRFVMVHVIGPTRNLDQYMKDIQAAAAKL
ncbi:MAG TPA: SRPBCC family protein [Acidobacteriaceae bacterium]